MAKRESMIGENLRKKLLASVKKMKAGKGTVVHTPAASARSASGLSQVQFAGLMGVSVRTLQEWERGRRTPLGTAQTLLTVVTRHPEVLLELVA